MYTDDTKVYGEADSAGDIKKLQSDLDSLADWADTWQLKFNTDKFRQQKSEGNLQNEKTWEWGENWFTRDNIWERCRSSYGPRAQVFTAFGKAGQQS